MRFVKPGGRRGIIHILILGTVLLGVVLVVLTSAAPAGGPLGKLQDAVNLQQVEKLGLTLEARTRLSEDGFVILPSNSFEVYDVYLQAKKMGIPAFVTSDAVLHISHQLFDYALRLAEHDYLLPEITKLTHDLLTSFDSAYLRAQRDLKVPLNNPPDSRGNSTTNSTANPADLGLVCLRENVAFFAVAARLLNPHTKVPDYVKDIVDKEMALIEGHSGVASSPLFGIEEDYTQYIPRGHYTRAEEFKRYFKAMMWYGRMSFVLDAREPIGDQARKNALKVILLARALDGAVEGARARWQGIYDITSFFAGASDDLCLEDIASVVCEVLGPAAAVGPAPALAPAPGHGHDPATELSRLSRELSRDKDKIDAFLRRVKSLRPSRISSITGASAGDSSGPGRPGQPPVGPASSPGAGGTDGDKDTAPPLRTLRFMGQRFIPDSYIFEQLVFRNVGRYTGYDKHGNNHNKVKGKSQPPFTLGGAGIRAFPRGLDVMAVLGSDLALDILRRDGDTSYEGYDEQMTKLRAEFGALSEADWQQNLYYSWLYAIKPLLSVEGVDRLPFARDAWLRKQLTTALGAWTELRHDTVLYAKQSYTSKGFPVQKPGLARGYVEPVPEVYSRIRSLIDRLSAMLDAEARTNPAASRGQPGQGGQREQRGQGVQSASVSVSTSPSSSGWDEFIAKLDSFANLLGQLEVISRKELAGKQLTEAEYRTIDEIGQFLKGIATLSPALSQRVGGASTGSGPGGGPGTGSAGGRMALVVDVHTDSNSRMVLQEAVGDPATILALVKVDGRWTVCQGAVYTHYEFKRPASNRMTDEEWQDLNHDPGKLR